MKKENFEYKKRNMLIWNEVAPRYHDRWANKEIGPFGSTKKLIYNLDIKKSEKILDVACGTGLVSRQIIRKVGKNGMVLGIDTSIKAMLIAKNSIKNQKNLFFVNADAENFLFNKKFNRITCQFALFFFPDAKIALKNMKKHLEKNGMIGITTHGKNTPFFSSIIDSVTKFIPDYLPPNTPSLDRFGTKEELQKIVKDSGFSKICINDYIFHYSPGTFTDYWNDYIKYVAKPIKSKINNLNKKKKKELKKMIYEKTLPYTNNKGIIKFPWEVLILTAKNTK